MFTRIVHGYFGTARLIACLLGALVGGGAMATTITVDSTSDTVANDGHCTLREAIVSANTNAISGVAAGECAAGQAFPTVDTIAFNIPDTDSGCTGNPKVCTIKPAALNWPRVTAPAKIDGYSQHGSSVNTLAVGDNAVLLIELDATNLPAPAAIYLGGPFSGGDSSGSTIQGLVISHINGGVDAICSSCNGGGSNSHTITGNFIGTDATGTAASSTGSGVELNGSMDTIIGGTTPDKRNVILAAGEAIILGGSDNTTVQGNYIGIDKTGTLALSFGRGIDVVNSSSNLIGGATPGAGNVIGSWSDDGIILQNGNNNLVQGNLVGTDATGTVRLGGQIGVEYAGAGTGNKIGGASAGEGNVVAGATLAGIELFFDTSPDLVVQGNLVGTDITGKMPLGNAQGILAYAGAGIIGGTAAGAGNRIAFNSSLGVSIFAGAKNVPILGNDIYANGSLGISLTGTATPTPNDDGDGDSGNNNLQNYPVIDGINSVTIGPKTTVHVSGSLNSEANKTYRLEFFANAGCDHSHNGQGKIFLVPAHDVTTNPNDVTFGPFDFTVPADRHVITATATDPSGNTSEFSVCSTQDTIFSDGVEGN